MATSYKNQGAGYNSSVEIGQGAWQESGDPAVGGTVGISSNGTLTCTGWSNTQSGSVGITGNGSLACLGTALNKGGTVNVTANGNIVGLGISDRFGDVGITGDGSIIIPPKAWGSVGVSGNGTLTVTSNVGYTGIVDLSGNGTISGVFWINQPVEKVWMESKLVQGVVGVSLLKRRVRKL